MKGIMLIDGSIRLYPECVEDERFIFKLLQRDDRNRATHKLGVAYLANDTVVDADTGERTVGKPYICLAAEFQFHPDAFLSNRRPAGERVVGCVDDLPRQMP